MIAPPIWATAPTHWRADFAATYHQQLREAIEEIPSRVADLVAANPAGDLRSAVSAAIVAAFAVQRAAALPSGWSPLQVACWVDLTSTSLLDEAGAVP